MDENINNVLTNFYKFVEKFAFDYRMRTQCYSRAYFRFVDNGNGDTRYNCMICEGLGYKGMKLFYKKTFKSERMRPHLLEAHMIVSCSENFDQRLTFEAF